MMFSLHTHFDGSTAEAIVARDGEQVRDGATLVACGLSEPIACQLARSYVALMSEVAETGEEVAPLPARHAAQLLMLLATGSRRDARRYAQSLGCGGGSRDLDLAIGRALVADPQALVAALGAERPR